jgi:predicted deacylase
MRQQHHALKPATPGTEHWLTSLHFGAPGRGPKAFIQASLHADEVPGMLVAWHLRRLLAELQNAGRLLGEVVLVPAANPPGLSQFVLRGHQGRFDLASGENFNRGYADLTDSVAQALAGGPVDVPRVRAALRDAVAALPAPTLLASLRKTLFALAVDADIVLDLHCDGEALLHGYTTPGCWPQAELLAACMGWHVALLAERSGGDPFDEACSMVWPQLARGWASRCRRPAWPSPSNCAAKPTSTTRRLPPTPRPSCSSCTSVAWCRARPRRRRRRAAVHCRWPGPCPCRRRTAAWWCLPARRAPRCSRATCWPRSSTPSRRT